MHILKLPTQPTFERSGIKGTKFPTQPLTDKTQFVLIETETGHQTTILEKECVFSYYILEGEGSFIIDGEQESCTTGDLVVIPAGKAFRYVGNLKMLLNVTPPFDPNQEVVVKE